MQIIISNSSEIPIYQQIVEELKQKILSKELIGGDLLPSIRTLAKDLKISNITTKRAYEELEKQGFIESNSTRGYFVKNMNQAYLEEEILQKIEEHLLKAVQVAQNYQITREDVFAMLANLYEEE